MAENMKIKRRKVRGVRTPTVTASFLVEPELRDAADKVAAAKGELFSELMRRLLKDEVESFKAAYGDFMAA